MKTSNPLSLKCVTSTCTKGVRFSIKKNTFRVHITQDNKLRTVGSYNNIDLAVEKFKKAERYVNEGKDFKKEFHRELKEELEAKGYVQVKGYPSYFVSEDGEICSIKLNKIKMLKPWVDLGYSRVDLDSKTMQVHIIVANAFCKGRTKTKRTVNHKDGNKLNNKASNLEWMSYLENNLHAVNILGYKRGVYCGGKAGVANVRRTRNGKKFTARIRFEGTEEHLGTFDTIYEAEHASLVRHREIKREILSRKENEKYFTDNSLRKCG